MSQNVFNMSHLEIQKVFNMSAESIQYVALKL